MKSRLLFICLLFNGICLNLFSQTARPHDILIDEILPDPTPPQGLPNSEFIELKNVSSTRYHLINWKIQDAAGSASIKTDFILEPDSFVVICASSSVSEYNVFGSAIGVSKLPSLNNDGDTIWIRSPEGVIIHAVAYDKSWYKNDLKSLGGWSLEMIDPKNPCAGSSNWKACIDRKGGTPGQINSISQENPDLEAPRLLRTYSIDEKNIVAVFDEPLDSGTAANPSNYSLDPMGQPIAAESLGPMFQQARLTLPSNMSAFVRYKVQTQNLSDCAGNAIGPDNHTETGLPLQATANDLVINEILFNPAANGYDYLEIYNRSKKIMDLRDIYLSGRKPNGSLETIVVLSPAPMLIFPGDYFVFTENAQWLKDHYLVNNPEHIIELHSLPSMPDDRGDLILSDVQGQVIDELAYDQSWQFQLLANTEGIALERMDPNHPTQDPQNWSSAASVAGFGTPGYQNSEFRLASFGGANITISPNLFSPDNDGFEDFCFIHYQLPEPGWVANLSIYDGNGKPVRVLIQSATLGNQGDFRWDGLDDQNKKLPTGIYVLKTELFNLNGATREFKNAVVLAKKF
ncbi:MAG: lamin tail domain-containing protein [Chitinophagales bacterium]